MYNPAGENKVLLKCAGCNRIVLKKFEVAMRNKQATSCITKFKMTL